MTYYLMHRVDGDECLLAHCATLVEVQARLLTELQRDPRADLSIWTSKGLKQRTGEQP